MLKVFRFLRRVPPSVIRVARALAAAGLDKLATKIDPADRVAEMTDAERRDNDRALRVADEMTRIAAVLEAVGRRADAATLRSIVETMRGSLAGR